ncbi:MAG: MFS transporter [Propionibacteriaceae bacterium]|jgi:MFS family permease|nr:MFS transporter [Propionibacteriaceae bacterium]
MKKFLGSFGFSPIAFVQLVFITVNAQLIYAFWDIRNTLPKDFPIALGVTDAEAGTLYSMQGLVIILGTIALGWIGDRFRIRNIMLTATLAVGGISLFMTVASPHLSFPVLLACFFAMLLFSEVLFKPANFKAVRVSTTEEHQGVAFSFFEGSRGLMAFVISLVWTAMVASGADSKTIMMTASVIVLVTAVLVFVAVPKDARVGDDDMTASSTLEAIKGVGKVAKMPVVWFAGINVFCVYGTYVAAGTYFARYLQAGYGTAAVVTAVFAPVVIGLRMLPLVTGALVDRLFKSAAHFMRFMEIILAVLLAAIALIFFTSPAAVTEFPAGETPQDIVPGATFWALIVLMLCASACCFMIRGVYYAPIGEFGVPAKHSSSAMSFAITLGYIPALLGPIVFGSIIVPSIKNDAGDIVTEVLTPTNVLGGAFLGLAALALVACVMSTVMVKLKAKRDAEGESATASA